LILLKFHAKAVEIECDYRYHSGWCDVQKVDLTKQTIGEPFTLSASPEKKQETKRVKFDNIGRVDHMPLVLQEFPILSELKIRSSEIPILRDDLFDRGFRGIQKLELTSDKIKILEERSFQHLVNLQEINLSHNEIRSLAGKLFQRNRKLKSINLGGNKINVVQPEVFRNLNELELVGLLSNKCFSQSVGCTRNCRAKVDHAELNRKLQTCYDNYGRSFGLQNQGENCYFITIRAFMKFREVGEINYKHP
jgi:hypothetical protein